MERKMTSHLTLTALLSILLFLPLQAKVIKIPIKEHYHAEVPLDASLRHPSAPFLSGDTFRAMCKHHVDEAAKKIDTSRIEYGDPIFVRYAYLTYFLKKVRPHIKKPYVLVVHNDIQMISTEHKALLDDKKLLKCFGKNANKAAHPKLEPIPLGLANRCWKHGNIEILVRKIKEHKSSNHPELVYLNLNTGTHKTRPSIYKYFGTFQNLRKGYREKFASYLTSLAECKFTPSPRGTSEDCHRTWEALYMGTVPIVKSSFLDPLFDQLPVLIVEDFSVVTEEFLQEKWVEMKNETYNMERLYAPYWEKLIHRYQKK